MNGKDIPDARAIYTITEIIDDQKFTYKEIDNLLNNMLDMLETRSASNEIESAHLIATQLLISGLRREFQVRATNKASGEDNAGQENKE